jgi:hypothetical protein
VKGGRKRLRPGHSARQRAWVQSAAGRASARAASEAARIARRGKPRCGSKRKSDGQPCRAPALANGRCRNHGGLTPAGSAWHRVQYPDPLLQPEKYAKKVREVERRQRQQRERVAKMPPAERAKYEARSKAVKPRSVAQRESRRRDREAAELLLRRTTPAPDPEVVALEAELAAVRAERARLEAWLGGQISTQEQIDEC